MYIRTKDGVYDTSKGIYTSSIKMWAIGTVTIYDEQIINQSENLEELCDEFVLTFDDSNPHIYYDLKEILRYNKYICGNSATNIYGAIWCEWGLK